MADQPKVVDLLAELVALQKKSSEQAEKKEEESVSDVASTTAITVVTTAVSFLGAFALRDFLQSLFGKFEKKLGDRVPAAKLVYTCIIFVLVVAVLVGLVYIKKNRLEKKNKTRQA